jgi:hypothetical protein
VKSGVLALAKVSWKPRERVLPALAPLKRDFGVTVKLVPVAGLTCSSSN